MYKLIATVYEGGNLIGYKVTNSYVEEELSIDETYLLALSNLIINVEAGSKKSLIGKNGFDIKGIQRIDKDFGNAPAFHTISAYILKNASKAANMLFKPDLIIKQAINNINRAKERGEYREFPFREDIIIGAIVYDINNAYFNNLFDKRQDKHLKEKLEQLLEDKELNIIEIEKLIAKAYGYEVKNNEDLENIDHIRELLIKERKAYRKFIGYQVVNCGEDSVYYNVHDTKNKLETKAEIIPGSSKCILSYDLKVLMAKNGFNGCIGNARLGFSVDDTQNKESISFINKCITINILDTSILNKQICIRNIE